MTPFQFAKAHCSNFIPETSGCKGLIIENNGSISHMKSAPKRCLLDSPVQRCAFFEQCVMPLAKSLGPPYEKQNTVLRHKTTLEAIRSYRKACKLPCADDRPCPLCGRAMEPNQHFCETCADRRRKESNRRKNQNRSTPVQIMGVTSTP